MAAEREAFDPRAAAGVARAARPLSKSAADDPALIERLARARLVLLGEATHGTHQFYRERAEITKRLIADRGFCAVAIEWDWPDAYQVNRYVRGEGEDQSAAEALSGFRRFPTWMWRNVDVLDFVGWLRDYNQEAGRGSPVGFYGLDLYSLNASVAAVLDYLNRVDPQAAQRARARYSCFDHFGADVQAYGYAASFGLSKSCEEDVIRQLVEIRRQAAQYARMDGRIAREKYFFAEQNARLVQNAEQYYRTMFQGRISSWNLRDSHMAETLEAIAGFLKSEGAEPKIVVWAHNSHVGDARATEMGEAGEWTLGQLARRRHRGEVALVGFSTYEGSVTAARDWDAPAEIYRVRPALPESYEALMHATELPRFWIEPAAPEAEVLATPRLTRAIGVVYRPETERQSHYFGARWREQFDVLLHYDHTRAVEPLERSAEWITEEVAETFPSGL